MYFVGCETEPAAGKLVLCYECPPFFSHFYLLDNTPKATIYQGHCPLSSSEADPDLTVRWEKQRLCEDLYETVTCGDQRSCHSQKKDASYPHVTDVQSRGLMGSSQICVSQQPLSELVV